jgi:hypothetical protein
MIDGKGNFKDLFNYQSLMATLSQTTHLIYINPFIHRISLEVYLGNSQILPSNLVDELKTREPAFFVDYFQKLNSRRRGELVEMLVLDRLSIDMILGHDKADSSAVPIQAVILYANFKKIAVNLQLNILTELTHIANTVTGVQALVAVSQSRPAVSIITKQFIYEFSKLKGLSTDQVQAMKIINKEIIREMFAIPIWQDIYIKYKVLDTVDVRRRIEFKYKLQSLVYQILSGKTKAQLLAEFDQFLLEEKEYIRKIEEIATAKKLMEEQNKPHIEPQIGQESMRQKVSNICQKVSKQTWKYHIHVRLHSTIEVNYLNDEMKNELCVEISGLDVNLVKPRGRFHLNGGLMLKNFLVKFNLQSQQRAVQRSVFGNQDRRPVGNQVVSRESVKPNLSGPNKE